MYNNEIVKQYMGWCPNAPAMRTASMILTTSSVTLHPLEPDGGPGRSGRIDRGIKIAAVSIKILNRNKNLLWFSLLTGLVLTFMFTAQYGLRLLGTYPYDAIDFPRWLVLTFAIDFVSVFCLTVLLAGLLMRLSSGDPYRFVSFHEGLSRTKRYLKPLLTWSVIIAFVGTTISVPVSNFGSIPFTLFPVLNQFPFNFILLPEFYSSGPIGGTYAMPIAVSFTIVATGINIVLFILTLFVVPLLVLENRRLPEAVFGSFSHMKKLWGEIMVCFLIFGLVLFCVSLTSLLFRVVYGFVAPHMLLFWYPGGAWIAAAVLFMVALCALAFIISTIAGIATFNLYTYGKTGRISDVVQGKQKGIT
jgi:MFS family permease